MEALIASYGETSSDSDTESPALPPEKKTSQESTLVLPPPPLSLLDSPNSLGKPLISITLFAFRFGISCMSYAHQLFDVFPLKDFWTTRRVRPAE